ncbi:MAG: CRISPR-associated endonuclease Cas1 [Elainellaceae cyanobacterium]
MTTIYVAQPQTELKVQSRQLQIFQQQRFCFAVPLNRVNQVVILGMQPWAQKAINLALSLNIPVLYFEPNGQCIEYLKPPGEPATYLRAQLERSQDISFIRSMAESLVRARLHNARRVLQQQETVPAPAPVQQVLVLLQRLMDDLPLAPSVPVLKTYEETGTSFYRAALHRLLPDTFREHNRGLHPLRRLTDLGVALLSQRIQLVLQTEGLDVEIANLHFDALTRPPLVCDFLTELQIPLVDALALHLLTTHQILPDDFTWMGQGVFLRPAALDTFIQQWDRHLAAPIHHLYIGTTTHRHCIELQAQEYIATLLGDQVDYRPFLLMDKNQ